MSSELVVVIVGVVLAAGGLLFLEIKSRTSRRRENEEGQSGEKTEN